VLLNDLAWTSAAVGAAAGRNEKIALLAATMTGLAGDEVGSGVSYLAGVVPQGSIGLGWSTLAELPDPAGVATITVSEFDDWLTGVAGTRGPGSKEQRKSLVDDLFGRMTEQEQLFASGLLLGDLRQGASQGVMLSAMSVAWSVPLTDVRRAMMLSGDLSATVRACTDGLTALRGITLTVGTPILPMLASTAPSAAAALAQIQRPQLEWKLDGARIQIHKRGGFVVAYTRGLNVADVPEAIATVSTFPAANLILDGEVIGVDPDGRPMPFQETMGAFAQDGSVATVPLAAFYFDVLHVDGVDLIDLPLEERLVALDRIVPAEARIPRLVTTDAAEAERFLHDAVAEGQEGVMVKSLDAPYDAGRRGKSWLKVKPVHTLDLVVLAVEWGSGRRAGTLSNIHLGARSGDDFVMLGKTFKGMTDEILTWQTERFLELETHRQGRVVYVRPEQVVEVAVDGVQTSSRYPGGVALRFARVRRYRHDKTANTADTIETVRSLLSR